MLGCQRIYQIYLVGITEVFTTLINIYDGILWNIVSGEKPLAFFPKRFIPDVERGRKYNFEHIISSWNEHGRIQKLAQVFLHSAYIFSVFYFSLKSVRGNFFFLI